MKPVPKSISALSGSILLLMASACGAAQEPATQGRTPQAASGGPSVEISSPADGARIKGNVVDLDVEVSNFEVVKADGDTSGKSGHFHVYVNKEPPPAGTVIPKEAGIFHSTDDPIKLTGLPVGTHRLSIVLGDGAHARVGEAQDTLEVVVEGPSIDASAPAEIASGQDLQIDMKAEGVQIVKADQDQGAPGTTGHFHILVDPASPPDADGGQIAKDDKNIHTADGTYKVTGLSAGEHTIWVVLGDKTHVPFKPLVVDKLTVTVK